MYASSSLSGGTSTWTAQHAGQLSGSGDTRMHPHWLVVSGVQLLENAAMLVAVNMEEQQALGC